MIDLLNDIPFVSLFLKFLIASTVLLGSVWVLEKLKVINTPDLAELAWKMAIAGSFIAVLPVSALTSTTLTIESDRGAALVEGLNETRPFLDTLDETGNTANIPNGVMPQGDAASHANDIAKQALDAAEARLKESGVNAELKRETITQDSMTFTFGAGTDATIAEKENKSAANTTNARIQESEYDSEGNNNNTFWYLAADLRTKDLALLGWIGLAFLATLALLFSYKGAVRNLGSRVRVDAEDNANKTLRAICEKADIRHVPYLSRSDDIKSPVCLPRREICLPNWAFDDMPEAEFKSLLAHELGHMVRRDPLMLMVLQFLSRVFFFQPLFIVARRRLTDIAELAADEWAAKQAENSRAVANALFTCATKIHETRQIQWGLAMAGNKSILKQRVERLIGAQSTPFKTAGTFAKTAVGLGVLGLSMGLPSIEFAGAMNAGPIIEEEFSLNHPHREQAVVPLPDLPAVVAVPETVTQPVSAATRTATASAFASAGGNQYFINRKSNSGNMQVTHDGRSVSLKWKGHFRLNQEEDNFTADSQNGSLKLKADIKGEEHALHYKVKDGKMSQTYRVDGDNKELDAAGKKWLKEAISILLQAGYDSENRVARLYKKGKAKAVFKAIEGFDQDHVRRVYLSHLIGQETLDDKEISKIVDIASSFESDFEKRLTLSLLLSEEKVSDKMLPKVLAAAKSMDSDYEKRLLVTHYITELKLTDKSTSALIDIAENIDSDFELRLLMSTAINEADMSDKNMIRLLDVVAKNMDSDFEKRMLLVQTVNEFERSDAVAAKVLETTDTIDSDFERRVVLNALIANARLDEKNWLKAISVTSSIDSEHEKKQVFHQMRHELPDNKKVQEAYAKATANIDKQEFDEYGWTIELENDIIENLNEVMAELAEEMRDIEIEQAEMLADIEEEQAEILEELQEELAENGHTNDPAFARRMAREKQRALSELMRDRSNLEREVERATAQAKRQIKREINRIQREVESAKGSLKRELSQSLKQLARTQKQLERSLEKKQAQHAKRLKRQLKQTEKQQKQDKEQAEQQI